jgi:hypothetical protein
MQFRPAHTMLTTEVKAMIEKRHGLAFRVLVRLVFIDQGLNLGSQQAAD